MQPSEAIRILASDPTSTAVLTDFDGSLSEIVDHPEDARPLDGAREVMADLAGSMALVAVVSGRSLDDLVARFAVPGVVLAGSYGRERSDRPARRPDADAWAPVALAARRAVERLPGVVVETKDEGVALHYRNAPERGDDVAAAARRLAADHDLEIRPGRAVVELTAPGPGKGDALLELVIESGVATAMYAGDDVADVEAFEAMRRLPHTTVAIAVASGESPPALRSLADVSVDGPAGYLAFLRRLRDAVSR